MEEYKIDGLTNAEFDEKYFPESPTDNELAELGILNVPDVPTEKTTDKTYNPFLVKARENSKEYEKLSYADTATDMLKAAGTEAIHLVQPKDKEWQYESRTRAAENAKQLTRWSLATAGFFIPLGAAIKGLQGIAKGTQLIKSGAAAINTGKALNVLEALFGSAKFIKTGTNASKAAKVGAWAVNNAIQGSAAGAIADFAISDPNIDGSHLADTLPESDALSWLQTREDDTLLDYKLKTVAEGLIVGGVFGNGIAALGLIPEATRVIRNALKPMSKTPATEEGIAKVAKESFTLEQLEKDSDLLEAVHNFREEANALNKSAEELIIDNVPLGRRGEALEILKTLENGKNITFDDNGRWQIKIEKWDDAYLVPQEEYIRQLKEADQLAADKQAENIINEYETKIKAAQTAKEKSTLTAERNAKIKEINVREGDTALAQMNASVEHTWRQRNILDQAEQIAGNTKATNKIVKYYTDSWNINNKINVVWADGLDGNVSGYTKQAKNQGKNKPKSNQTQIDKKKVEIEKLKNRIRKLNNAPTKNPANIVKEQLRIAETELKQLEKEAKEGIAKDKDITIYIDKNTKNPYAVLRSELEHAYDLAKGTVPNQTEKHFSRYQGLNEAETAPIYTYKKSSGKAEIIKQQAEINNIQNNVKQYETEGYKFKQVKSDGFGEHRYDLISPDGEKLGYVEYTIDDGVLTIDYVNNITKRFKDNKTGMPIPKAEGEISSIPNIGEKLIDKIISENPNLKIHWDAASTDGFSFKAKYINKHPELKDRVEGVSTKEELDKQLEKDDNPLEGDINARSNSLSSDEGNRGKVRTTNKANDIRTLSTNVYPNGAERNSNSALEATLDGSYNKFGTGKQTAQNNSAKASITSAKDAAKKIINNELPIDTVEDIDNIIAKIPDEIEPKVSGHTYEDVLNDGTEWLKDLQERGLDHPALREAVLTKDATRIYQILRKQTKAADMIDVLDKQQQLLKNQGANSDQLNNILEKEIKLIQYMSEIRTAGGRFLEGQKVNKKLLQNFTDLNLDSYSTENINKFIEQISKNLGDDFKLYFTRGDKVAFKNNLYKTIMEYDNGLFKDVLYNDKGFIKVINDIADEAFKNGGNVDKIKAVENIRKHLVSDKLAKIQECLEVCPTVEQKVQTISKWNKAVSWYKTSILSGVSTFTKNAISGIANTFIFPYRKILAGQMENMLGRDGSALVAEGEATLAALNVGWKEAFALGKKAFDNGEGILAKMGQSDFVSEYAKRFDERSPISKMFHIMNHLLVGSDELFSQLNYRAIKRGEAYTQAQQWAKTSGITDEKLIAKYADDYFDHTAFDKNGSPIDPEAFYETKEILYQQPLDGNVLSPTSGHSINIRESGFLQNAGQALTNATNQYPILKFFFPFPKTMANIAQQVFDTTVVAPFLDPSRKRLFLANTKQGALYRSQLAMAQAVYGIGFLSAMSGNLTGSEPTDSKEREALKNAGWQPYSIKIGDKWVSYRGYAPFDGLLAIAADLQYLTSRTPHIIEDKGIMELVYEGLGFIMNNLVDTAGFRQALDDFTVLINPETLSPERMTKWAGRKVQGFLPLSGMVRQLSSLGHKDKTKTPLDFWQNIFNGYCNKGLGDYKRDIFGNRIDVVGLLATNATDVLEGVEYEELQRLGSRYGYNPSKLTTKISQIGKFDATSFKNSFDLFEHGTTLHDKMLEEMSTIKIDGKTLREAVRELVTSDYYFNLKDGFENDTSETMYTFNSKDETKKNAINEIFREYADAAKESALEKYPEYVDRNGRTVEEAEIEAANQKARYMNEAALNSSLDDITNLF